MLIQSQALGGGIGHYCNNTSRANISLMMGPAWVDTDYKQSAIPVNSQKIAAAIVVGQVRFFQFSKTNLDPPHCANLRRVGDPGVGEAWGSGTVL